jgi:hypothetical protein
MQTHPRLNAGFFVGGNHKVVGSQSPALPDSLIEIKHPCGFGLEMGIARKDPAPVLPGAKGIFVEPPPMVRPLICAAIPRRMTARTRSARLKRERGSPSSLGNWQAMALTCTRTSGGKTGRAPGTRKILKTGEACFEKPFAPFADDLPRQ